LHQRFNIYCDESCHLEHDRLNPMVVGALVCPELRTREIAEQLRKLKRDFGLEKPFELKWSQASPRYLPLYKSAVNLFFDDPDLRFRAVIIDKRILRHEDFAQDHDTFYYKMQYTLLNPLISTNHEYCVYLDIKDTRSTGKMAKLHEVLCNEKLDFSKTCITRVQPVRSEQIEQLQLADTLIGAVGYANRGGTSADKRELVDLIQRRSAVSLISSTSLGASKVNLLKWQPRA